MKPFWSRPSTSLKISYYPPPNYFLTDFKEIPSHHLGKKWGHFPPYTPWLRHCSQERISGQASIIIDITASQLGTVICHSNRKVGYSSSSCYSICYLSFVIFNILRISNYSLKNFFNWLFSFCLLLFILLYSVKAIYLCKLFSLLKIHSVNWKAAFQVMTMLMKFFLHLQKIFSLMQGQFL